MPSSCRCLSKDRRRHLSLQKDFLMRRGQTFGHRCWSSRYWLSSSFPRCQWKVRPPRRTCLQKDSSPRWQAPGSYSQARHYWPRSGIVIVKRVANAATEVARRGTSVVISGNPFLGSQKRRCSNYEFRRTVKISTGRSYSKWPVMAKSSRTGSNRMTRTGHSKEGSNTVVGKGGKIGDYFCRYFTTASVLECTCSFS